jgi:hypothetical protein
MTGKDPRHWRKKGGQLVLVTALDLHPDPFSGGGGDGGPGLRGRGGERASGEAQQASNGVKELLAAQGLDEVLGAAGLSAAAAGVVSGVAGDREDGHTLAAGQAPQGDGGVVPVEHGHLHVEEHEVHGGGLGDVQGLAAVAGEEHTQAGLGAQVMPEELAVGGVVIYDEHDGALLDETFDGADEAARRCVACRA